MILEIIYENCFYNFNVDKCLPKTKTKTIKLKYLNVTSGNFKNIVLWIMLETIK